MQGGMTAPSPQTGPRVIVVCGPTGIGKTRVAIDLAQRFQGEIVGADSMQIYRHMDIGTAKPTPEEQACIRHHMVDIAEPDTPYDAARYAEEAGRAVQDIHRRGRVPVVAGGTGLYIKALIYGLFDSQPPDPQYRRQLEETAEARGAAYLHALNNSVVSFLMVAVYKPDDPVFSFGVGLYGIVVWAIVVAGLLVLGRKGWASPITTVPEMDEADWSAPGLEGDRDPS